LLSRVTSRTTSGPYKNANDKWSGSPGDWTRVVGIANMAINSGIENLDQNNRFWYIGQRAAAAAFVWLVTGKVNSNYYNVAKNQLITMCTDSRCDVRYHAGDSQSIGYAKMIPRVCFIYDILKQNMTSGEITTVESNLTGWGNYLKNLHQIRHSSVMGLVSQQTIDWAFGDPAHYAYRNASNVDQAHITTAAAYMNNLTSMSFMGSLGLLGVVLNNSTLINEAKLFFDDWLKYGVHSSGICYDYTRCGDYGIHQQGRVYSTSNMQNAILFGEALRRKRDDNSIFSASTSIGYGGWDGGPKTLKLAIETDLNLRTKLTNYYSTFDWTDSSGIYGSPGTVYNSGNARANTHLGKAVSMTVVDGSTGLYSYHDLGYLMAYNAYNSDPTFQNKLYNVIRRDTSVYPNLETFPTSTPDTGSGYDQGYEWTDVMQTLPCIWLIYGKD
jgi:hypothetical protein